MNRKLRTKTLIPVIRASCLIISLALYLLLDFDIWWLITAIVLFLTFPIRFLNVNGNDIQVCLDFMFYKTVKVYSINEILNFKLKKHSIDEGRGQSADGFVIYSILTSFLFLLTVELNSNKKSKHDFIYLSKRDSLELKKVLGDKFKV